MNAMNKISKKAWRNLDHTDRLKRRLDKLVDEAQQSERDPEWVPSWSEKNKKLYEDNRNASNAYLDALDPFIALGAGGLCPNIALKYKHRPSPTLQAVIHNNIKKTHYDQWWETTGKTSFMAFFEYNGKSTPCPEKDSDFDDRLRQFDPFYGYSLSQAIQAEIVGTVKASSHIIDIMRTGGRGFVRGDRPVRKLP